MQFNTIVIKHEYKNRLYYNNYYLLCLFIFVYSYITITTIAILYCVQCKLQYSIILGFISRFVLCFMYPFLIIYIDMCYKEIVNGVVVTSCFH